MITEPKHKYFGTSASEWIAAIPNELDVDAVGLWQIIPVGRTDFGLNGAKLQDFSRRAVVALLQAGAVPVRASTSAGTWKTEPRYGQDVDIVADSIISEWLIRQVDPDTDGLWFALLPDK